MPASASPAPHESFPTVVLGAMAYGDAPDPAVRARVFHAAFDAGIRAVDTAPLYEFGASEETLGRVLRERREPVMVMTKVGLRWDDTHGDVLFEAPIGGSRRAVRKDARPASIRRDLDESLGRLGVERVDVVHLHHPDRHVPIEESVGTLAELVREGKARAIGLSNHAPGDVRRAIAALGDVPLASLQDDYSLLSRWVENELLPIARANGLRFLCYAPLARGLLAGSGTRRALDAGDWRRNDPRFHESNLARVREAMRELDAVARERAERPETTALAWLLAQPGVSAVIVGARSVEQARANAEAIDARLDASHEARLRGAFERVTIDHQAGRGAMANAVGLARRALGKVKRVVRGAP